MYKHNEIWAFVLILSGCVSTYPYEQGITDSCSQVNAEILKKHVLTGYIMQENTCAIIYTEDYKIYTIAPMYPSEAIEKGIEGDVRVKFNITSNGTVVNPKVISSTVPEIFNSAAIKTIQLWRFQAISKKAKSSEVQQAIQELRFRKNTGYILQINPRLNSFK